jgi:hypothetical protein
MPAHVGDAPISGVQGRAASFFSETPELEGLIRDAGARGEPEFTFGEAVSSADEFSRSAGRADSAPPRAGYSPLSVSVSVRGPP